AIVGRPLPGRDTLHASVLETDLARPRAMAKRLDDMSRRAVGDRLCSARYNSDRLVREKKRAAVELRTTPSLSQSEKERTLGSSPFRASALWTSVRFLDCAAENCIDRFRIVNAVIDLKSMMIHLCSAIRANHFGIGHFAASYCLSVSF